MKHLFLALLVALCISPGKAKADPISSAIVTFLTSVGVGTTIATFAAQVAFGAAFSLVGQLFRKKPKVSPNGIQTEQTTTGDTTPQKLVVGRYGLEGHAVAPAYSHGSSNQYLTYILEVSNIPVQGSMTRIAIDGKWSDIDQNGANVHPDYGKPLIDLNVSGTDHGWIIFKDGTQTTADTMLVDKYGLHPDRPWTTSHILEGTAYIILTFKLNNEVFSGLPAVRCEVNGMNLYDPRKDTTVGGSGAHRWSDPATWEFSRNPQVINYNLFRGITLPTGDVYGGNVPEEDLPLDSWFAAMNECDVLIGSRVQYQAGFEIDTSVEPLDIVTEMNRASFTQISEVGGVFRPRTGAPAAAVLSLTDDDIIITEPEELEPFPGLNDTHNAITGTYVEPTDVYQGREADPIYNAQWETDDGGRRLPLNMGLPAVTNRSQAQHLLNAYINDERRFRIHSLVLPASYAELEPLDVIDWTSDRNGYVAEAFEVVTVEYRLDTALQFVTLRPRDALDVAWEPGQDLPDVVSHTALTPPTPTIPTLTVAPFTVQDGSSNNRKPAIRLTWDATEAPEAQLLKFEIRVSGNSEVTHAGAVDAQEGVATISGGILPAEAYQVRARYVLGRRADWSAWMAVTAPDIRVGQIELEDSLKITTTPGGLVLSTSVLGDGVSRVEASWNAVSDAVGYEVGVTEGAGSETEISTGGPAWSARSLPGVSFSIRVRSVSSIGTKSAWSAPAVIVAAADTTPPVVPTGLVATAAFEAIWLEWNANTEGDLAGYHVFEQATATPVPDGATVATFIASGPQLVRQDLVNAETRHYWVRAVDTSGNKSAWTGPQSATAREVGDVVSNSNLSAIIDDTSFANGFEPIRVVGSLPLTKETEAVAFNDKIYRWDAGAGAYVATVPTDDVVGQFTAASIAAGAIGSDELAADTILGRHLVLTDPTNRVTDSEFQDAGSWTLVSGGQLDTTAANTWGDGAAGAIYSSEFDNTGLPGSFTIIAQMPIDRAVPVKGGAEYFYQYSMRRFNAGTGRGRFAVWFRDIDGVGAGSTGLGVVETTSNIPQEVSGTFTAPANAVRMQFGFQQDRGGSSGVIFRRALVREMDAAELIVDGGITATHVGANEVIANTANIADAVISDAKIIDLSAAKIQAGTGLFGTVTVDGTALSDTTSRAADPASRVNAGTTQIDPGKIIVADGSGNLMLNGDFRFGDARGWQAQPAWTTITAKDSASGGTHISGAITPYMVELADNTGGAARLWRVSDVIPVTEGDQYTFSALGARLGNAKIGLRFEDETGASVSFQTLAIAPINNNWQKFEAAFTVPAGAVQVEPRIEQDANSAFMAVADIRVIRKSSGSTIITPQGIDTPELKTAAVTTDRINGRAVTDPQLFEGNTGTGPGIFPSYNEYDSFSVVQEDDDSILVIDVRWQVGFPDPDGVDNWAFRVLVNGTIYAEVGGGFAQEVVPMFAVVNDLTAGTYTVSIRSSSGTGTGGAAMTINNYDALVQELIR